MRILVLVLCLPNALSAFNAGEVYELRLTKSTKHKSEFSSGSSNTRAAYEVEIIDAQDGVFVLEWRLPEGTSDRSRDREWRLPARVMQNGEGALTLLNADEALSRLQVIFEKYEGYEAACGRWIFTWVAQKNRV